MEANEVEQMISDKVDSSLRGHRQEMLRDIESIVEKISGTSNVAQLNKLSTLVNGGEKFKRKSNEEQFKYNSSVSLKLEEAEQSLEAHKLQEGRDKVAEGNYFIICTMFGLQNLFQVNGFKYQVYFFVSRRD